MDFWSGRSGEYRYEKRLGSYIPVNYNIEYRFCMLDEELCGLPLHGLLLRSFRLKRGTRGSAAQTAAFLHA